MFRATLEQLTGIVAADVPDVVATKYSLQRPEVCDSPLTGESMTPHAQSAVSPHPAGRAPNVLEGMGPPEGLLDEGPETIWARQIQACLGRFCGTRPARHGSTGMAFQAAGLAS